MNSNNLLRKQVVSEIKKKRLITSIIFLLSFIYLLINLFFGDSGFIRYKQLINIKHSLENEIVAVQKDTVQMKTQITALKENPFYLEKHAREEFGLARPDEYVFQYDR